MIAVTFTVVIIMLLFEAWQSVVLIMLLMVFMLMVLIDSIVTTHNLHPRHQTKKHPHGYYHPIRGHGGSLTCPAFRPQNSGRILPHQGP